MGSRPFTLIVAASVFFTNAAAAHEGWGIVVDASGSVYVGDIPANTIWRISKEGRVERIMRKHSHALVLDSAGNLYGTDPHLTLPIGSVWRRSPDGRVTDMIAPTRSLRLGLQSFIIDEQGNMYSVNARNAQTPELALLKRSPSGEITVFVGSAPGHADGTGSAARFSGIDGMTWAPDGALYVTDGPYVRRIAADGRVTTVGNGPVTETRWDENLLGITADSAGALLVADHAGRRVLRIAGDNISTMLETGVIWAPTGIFVAPDGVFVLEHLRMPLALLGDLAIGPYMRVRKVSSDGAVTELARMWGTRSAAAGIVVTLLGAAIAAAITLMRPRRRT